MSRKKEQIINNSIKAGEQLTVFFAGAFRSYSSGQCPSSKRAPMYKNMGVFKNVGRGRIQCDKMPFSRHISKVSCIINKHGQVTFGQYCPNCKTAVPAKWCNCPTCKGQLRRVSIDD